MSRGSALARVIGLTRSFSPLNQGERANEVGPKAEIIAATEIGAPSAGTDDYSPEISLLGGTALPEGLVGSLSAAPGSRPALAQVTVVAGDAAGVVDEPAPESVTAAAINAIEADIASLLSSLDIASDQPPPLGDDEDGDEAMAGAGGGDEATLALLSELDRMWRADPAVGNSYMR